MNTILETLRTIVAEKLDLEAVRLTLDCLWTDINIDSMDMIDLICRVEDAFDIEVPNSKLDIKTVGELVNTIEQLCSGQVKA